MRKILCLRCQRTLRQFHIAQKYHPSCSQRTFRELNRKNQRVGTYIWRKAVLKANPFCGYCGSTEKLEADHIRCWVLFPELRYDPLNGQALCNACHKLKTFIDLMFIKWSKNLLKL